MTPTEDQLDEAAGYLADALTAMLMLADTDDPAYVPITERLERDKPDLVAQVRTYRRWRGQDEGRGKPRSEFARKPPFVRGLH